MSFWIYKKDVSAGFLYLEQGSKIKLTGSDGLIAAFVESQKEQGSPLPWKLDEIDIVRIVMPGSNAEEYSVVFDMSPLDSSEVSLFSLTAIRGHSKSIMSDIVLVCRPLFEGQAEGDAEVFKRTLKVELPLDKREVFESLGMNGGILGGKFYWTRPKMNIGGAIYPSMSEKAVESSL